MTTSFADDEMTTREAIAYLNERVPATINDKILRGMKSAGWALPEHEKRDGRLVWRQDRIDAFLEEHGTNPADWRRAGNALLLAEVERRRQR